MVFNLPASLHPAKSDRERSPPSGNARVGSFRYGHHTGQRSDRTHDPSTAQMPRELPGGGGSRKHRAVPSDEVHRLTKPRDGLPRNLARQLVPQRDGRDHVPRV